MGSWRVEPGALIKEGGLIPVALGFFSAGGLAGDGSLLGLVKEALDGRFDNIGRPLGVALSRT